MKYSKLFIPGPTNVRKEVLEAQLRPMIGHRGGEYTALHERIVGKMKQFAQTERDIFIFASSGTGAMEAAIRNGVDGKVLHTVCGAFSARWEGISRACGKETAIVSVPIGKAIRPEMVEEALQKEKFSAVTITHSETSTGVLNPIKEIIDVVRRIQPEALIFVDAVSSFGGTLFSQELVSNIDTLIWGSQKCFAIPPGLSFAIVSPRSLLRSAIMKDKGYYFDFTEMKKFSDKNLIPATPAISLLYALDRQLDDMVKEGMPARAARHGAMMKAIHEWISSNRSEFGFEFTAEDGFRGPTLTTVTTPDGFDVGAFRNAVKERGYTISDGYGPLAGKGFRIGHMGDWTLSDVEGLLDAMSKALKEIKS
ncbi:alanine--glyoxylate aminotransferase family protein [bacterium]|nr:alanine--glyoxylate aminotransferase family protein [bacterium]